LYEGIEMNSQKIFDKFRSSFIELGKYYFALDDVKGIQKTISGIRVVTSHGSFNISTLSFKEFKHMIDNSIPPSAAKPRSGAIVPLVKSKVVPLDSNSVPVRENQPSQNWKVKIPIDNKLLNSAMGQLPYDNILHREKLVILSPAGGELGRGNPDGLGTISGRGVSGIINMSGKYRLVFKEYPGDAAIIRYGG